MSIPGEFTRIRTPFHGACLHDQWYYAADDGSNFTGASPTGRNGIMGVPNIFIFAVTGGNTQNLGVGLDFAGRGIVGFTACPGGATTDDYVGGSGGAKTLNVWKAYEDGIWSSSTTCLVYLRKSAASGSVTTCTHRLSSYNSYWNQSGPLSGPNQIPWQSLTRTPDFYITPPAAGCPTTLQYTVTFYDDGTWTVA